MLVSRKIHGKFIEIVNEDLKFLHLKKGMKSRNNREREREREEI